MQRQDDSQRFEKFLEEQKIPCHLQQQLRSLNSESKIYAANMKIKLRPQRGPLKDLPRQYVLASLIVFWEQLTGRPATADVGTSTGRFSRFQAFAADYCEAVGRPDWRGRVLIEEGGTRLVSLAKAIDRAKKHCNLKASDTALVTEFLHGKSSRKRGQEYEDFVAWLLDRQNSRQCLRLDADDLDRGQWMISRNRFFELCGPTSPK